MVRGGFKLVMLSACLACDGGAGSPVADAASRPAAEDRDADGLCDATEVAMGSDPDRADTDGDGLLDGHELIAGSDARNRADPGSDHIVYLRDRADFPVALIVQGSGSDVTGRFSDRNAFDPQARRAGMFYRASVALSASPPDNVRGTSTMQARFDSVRGPTQLQFELHFALDADDAADAGALSSNAAGDCAAVLPFDYAATTDDGTELTQSGFVLIVTGASPPLSAAEYCLPVACL